MSGRWKVGRELRCRRGGIGQPVWGHVWVVRTPRGSRVKDFPSWREAMDWLEVGHADVTPRRDEVTGVCSECVSPPEAYHARSCALFRGYFCIKCEGRYFGDYCTDCPPPWWVAAAVSGANKTDADEEKP